MLLRLAAVGFFAVLAATALVGCGGEETSSGGSDGVTGPTGQSEPVEKPEVQRGLPFAGRYDSHTPAVLVAGVQQAVGKKDFLGLIKLVESKARFELSRNAKEWFFAAMRVMPDTEKGVLEKKGLTRDEFNMMDEEYYTAYMIWRGEKHQDLVAQLSGRLVSVNDGADGASATFLFDVAGTSKIAKFKLVATDRGWRIVVPGKVTAAPTSRPATAPASQPTTVPGGP